AALAGALDTLTHTQGTRPEGLGGSRDAGPAVAGPRPPYVTEAEAATLYSGYGRTGRTDLYRDDRNRVKIRIRIRIRIRNEIDSGIRVRAESSSYNGSYNSRYNSRYNRNNSSIRTYLWPYRTRPEGLRGLRNAGPAIAGPRPPYVIKAVRYSGYIKGL
ncbi:hypothetical protein L249_7121, partial [Ophiocordyceps polyrhachis-furcata BCC 54312]